MQQRPGGSHRATPSTPTPTTPTSRSTHRRRATRTDTILPAGRPATAVRTIRISPTVAVAMAAVLLAAVTPVGLHGLRGTAASTSGVKTLSFKAVADTYVSQAAAKAGAGSSTKLVANAGAGKSKVTLVRFNVSGIPAGATNVTARIVLQRDAHHLPSTTISANKVSTAWSETVSWAGRPALGAKVASTAVTSSTTSVTLNLGKVAPTGGAVAFAVSAATTADVARFQSRESGKGPVLQVTYTPPVKTDPSPSPTSTTSSSSSSSTSSSSTSTSTSTTSSSSSSSTTTSGTPGHCAVNAKLVPSCGELWGVAPGAFTDQKRTDALIDFEKTVGKTQDIFHAYHKDGELFPTADERAIATDPAHPRLLLENWKPSTSANWAQIANGAADGNIDNLAAYIKSTFHQPFFLTVWHEPENDVNMTAGSGMTAKDFHDMFRHTVLRLRADGVTNAVTVANFQSYPAYSATDWWSDLYPGDDVVDWVAEDAYNMGDVAGGKASGDFAATVNKPKASWTGFYNWAHTNHPDKPVMLAEWGVFDRSDSPGRQAWYFNDVRTNLAEFPQLKAMVYFDSPTAPKGSTNFDNTPAALAAYKALINSTPDIKLF
jgi:beta-mannanase